MSENQDKFLMYRTINWQEEIADIAGPIGVHDTRESWLARAARKSLVTHRHVKALFYGASKDPKYSVACKILGAADRARIDAAKLDANKLSTQFNAIAKGMQNADKDFYKHDITALRAAAQLLSGMDRA